MSNEDRTTVTRRRVLAGATTVGVAGLTSGAGTYAALSGSRTTPTTVNAGTLELTLATPSSRTFTVRNARPGDAGRETALVGNTGTIDGHLGLSLQLLECDTDDSDAAENRPCDWEPDTDNAEESGTGSDDESGDDTTGSDGGGGLGSHLSLTMGFETDSADHVVVDGVRAADLPFGETTWTDLILNGRTDSEHPQDATLYVEWNVDENAPEGIRNDAIGFRLTTHLQQS